MKRFLKFLFCLVVAVSLTQCSTNYVKDAYTQPDDEAGLINENEYQYWYHTLWDQSRFTLYGYQSKRANKDEIRFVNVLQSARQLINREEIQKDFNRYLSILVCRQENKNVINQIPTSEMLYRIVKEEIFLNGQIKFLIRFNAPNLADRISNINCD